MSRPALPAPSAAPGEVLVRVEAAVALEAPRDVARDRYAHRRRLRKLAFFLLREGPVLTARKWRAQALQGHIQRARRVVVAWGRRAVDGAWVAAVGPQPDAGLDVMAFPGEGVRAATNEAEARALQERCAGWLRTHPETVRAVHVHSGWSGRAFPLPAEAWGGAGAGREAPAAAREPQPPARLTRPMVRAAGTSHAGNGRYDLFLVGAGAYPCAYVLPYLTGRRALVMDLNPRAASEVGARYGFGAWTTSLEVLCEELARSAAPALVVAGYHESHLPTAEAALAANPATRVLLEKPPATTRSQVERLIQLRADPRRFIEIGYNRRHIPWVRHMKSLLGAEAGPTAITCSVREIRLPPWHWYLWPTQGTRVVGNLCHWLDLGVHLVGMPHVEVRVEAHPVPGAPDVAEAARVEVAFADGSTLTVLADDQGDGARGVEERIEVRRGALRIAVHDFLRWEEERHRRRDVRRRVRRDKGHAAMYRDFERRLATPGATPFYPDADLEPSCRLMLDAAEAAWAVCLREPAAGGGPAGARSCSA
ncbi:MAG TPA: Gfo/Idh/MocA family oxidoreductase [Longimicrobiales bacterium]|nr:Gfo/Idh/MocA family oxidoreductase [Longimicrobiales bacterium]